jgi:hypothetical protein
MTPPRQAHHVRWLLAIFSLGAALPLAAQDGMFVTAGRVLAGTPTESSFGFTVQKDLVGPVGVDGTIMELPGARPASGNLYGAEADFTLFSGATGVPTVFVGISGGIGFGGQQRLWSGGSVGVRMPFVVLGPVRIMAEGRWRSLSIDGRTGVEVALALGYHRRHHTTSARPETAGLWVPPPIGELLRARGIPDAKAKLLNTVVTTAVEEMGQPYVWGGTGNGSGGFDCSGLIQYAYRRAGIPIARTAVGQSGAGVAIRVNIDQLLPGDILVFSDHGDTPTHVGLYVGEGRFIHSASKGVQLSRLADDDPEGKFWLHRWIGVRRIVE